MTGFDQYIKMAAKSYKVAAIFNMDPPCLLQIQTKIIFSDYLTKTF